MNAFYFQQEHFQFDDHYHEFCVNDKPAEARQSQRRTQTYMIAEM